ncbi:peptide-methionine (S)-S-oxide reductase MsrA [Patescibacteria group bacterium]|nr:peptide-methionine (S)-S-oxide reductase MsrA [Patescibacteria group bacterium]
MKTIVLGGGCFWCLDPIFTMTEGITDVVVGYAGGGDKNPSYREVCGGRTGHAEVVKLTYNPNIVSLKKILEIFFTVHDPTTLNQQGADVGTQYRSIILYQDKDDMILANQIIDQLNESGAYENPIVTEVVPLQEFYPAEDYHQDYFANNPEQSYCQLVIAPKVEKFKRVFDNE